MSGGRPRVALISREYPPEVYGGAGVHVEYLSRELAAHVDVEVHCFGEPRSSPLVKAAYGPSLAVAGKAPHHAALRTLSVDLEIAAAVEGAALVHSHTWYANMAGHFAKLLYGIPHVMTSHSLEPLRPWKRDQLGGGYDLSCFAERTAAESADAIVAVSHGMKRDILACYPAIPAARVHVIHNGIDLAEYQRTTSRSALDRLGIDPQRPVIVFVGRITHQKGVVHLLEAAAHIDAVAQLVLCAGEPDTREIGREVERLVTDVEAKRGGLVWIRDMLPKHDVIELLSHARAFVCPSIYEPFGIVNLEAMACGAAVVASRVGGIPEIVEDGATGFLVPFEVDGSPMGGPRDRAQFARDLADRINQLVHDPDLASRMGQAGRARVASHFAWSTVAQRTAALYRSLL